jgi:hypothetical protein
VLVVASDWVQSFVDRKPTDRFLRDLPFLRCRAG